MQLDHRLGLRIGVLGSNMLTIMLKAIMVNTGRDTYRG